MSQHLKEWVLRLLIFIILSIPAVFALNTSIEGGLKHFWIKLIIGAY